MNESQEHNWVKLVTYKNMTFHLYKVQKHAKLDNTLLRDTYVC